jgi:hypothetical protein
MLIFILTCHIFGCIWIYTANVSQDEEFIDQAGTVQTPNWVTANGYDNYSDFQKYTIGVYFTVTTIATVGYGDITGKNSIERFICILMMVIGVILFSVIGSQIT